MRIFILEDGRILKKQSSDNQNIYLLDQDDGRWIPQPIGQYQSTNGIEKFTVSNEQTRAVETVTLYPKDMGISAIVLANGQRLSLVDTQEVSGVPGFSKLFSTDPAVRAEFQFQSDEALDDMEARCKQRVAEMTPGYIKKQELIQYAETVRERLNHKYFWNGRTKAGKINQAIQNLKLNPNLSESELVTALTWHRHARKPDVKTKTEKALTVRFPTILLK